MTKLTTRAGGDRYIEVWYGTRRLCRYNLRAYMTNLQGPRPYFHPVSTLQGGIVTQEKHFDHEWHNGLSLACPWVSGYNFWGGPTYVRDQGYQHLDNLGHQVHRRLIPRAASLDKRSWRQEVSWLVPGQGSTEFLRDERNLTIGGVDESEGIWHLDFDFTLTNPDSRNVVFGSPTTEGRPECWIRWGLLARSLGYPAWHHLGWEWPVRRRIDGCHSSMVSLWGRLPRHRLGDDGSAARSSAERTLSLEMVCADYAISSCQLCLQL